ncbi:hypothetical protein RFI_06375 [Reticulomyxa filosa]|uniref:alpha-L-fucosidase n=1 Tax=Reticulomyxa filosa TaxID=46433 RepID=X6NXY5_RETFI|nr:hypothetical protein RFI_06375 [Reticulomyxa filosa]|eukprot:ETO30743.1 hypothetical protein RFI_06375 [Reticulomyxa filosa]
MFLYVFWLVLQLGWCDVVIPTQYQVSYQTNEIVGLTHFNMGTYYGDSDPSCNPENWNMSGNPLSFNPYALNISNWAVSYKNLGAKSAVLTAKHGCGFCLWPTNVTIPSTGHMYNYSVAFSSYPHDIVRLFVDEMKKNNLGYGFYYSLTNNFYLNVDNHMVQNTTLLPGQVQVTQQQFEDIAMEQLTELFTSYGELTEFWFDGGTSDLTPRVQQLIQKYQPNMVVFNGQNVSDNPIRWVGTEWHWKSQCH